MVKRVSVAFIIDHEMVWVDPISFVNRNLNLKLSKILFILGIIF